jgi:hypothetical protein
VPHEPDFALSFVPYVVVPDHWPKYGFAAADSTHSSSSSTVAAQQDDTGGRAVGKQQVVHHAHASTAVDTPSSASSSPGPSPRPDPSNSTDDSTSTSGTWGRDASAGSSSSRSTSHGYSCSSSQQWLSPVSHESLQQVPLSQELLTSAFTATDWLLSGSGINVVDSGSTAILCHIGPRSITTAWVGDSRAVLGRRKQLWQLGRSQQPQQAGPLRPQQQSSGLQQPDGGGSSDGSIWQQLQQQEGDRWEVPLSSDHKPDRQDEYVSDLQC